MSKRKHIAVCVQCGRQFDVNNGGYYNKNSRRYTCPSCYRKIKGDYNEAHTGMRQSQGAMIAKIAGGVLFLIIAPTMEKVSEVLTSIVIGAALMAWALIPYISAKRAKQAELQTRADLRAEQAREPKTCPNCGATSTGKFCEYCGSKLV